MTLTFSRTMSFSSIVKTYIDLTKPNYKTELHENTKHWQSTFKNEIGKKKM